jgi:imidazole glycerol-phosphate synthase subunit HisH
LSKVRIAIVDYGMGNIRSVHNAFERVGCNVTTTASADEISAADALVLPGVGAFGEAMKNLCKRELIAPLLRAVQVEGKPLLGICLGMQLLAESSEEGGSHEGLGLVPGRVRRLDVPKSLRVPHVGWNSVSAKPTSPLFAGTHDGNAFYFVHSYHFECDAPFIAATTDYGSDVVAAVERDRVFGVQFHPERSQTNGLALLSNFVSYAST